MNHRSLSSTVIGMCLLVGACNQTSPDEARLTPETISATTPVPGTTSPPPLPRRGPRGGRLTAPPPVTVRYLDEAVELDAWTYCYGNVCADGSPPANPVDVGDPEEITISFPLPEWSFTASFARSGQDCARTQTRPLEPVREGEFVLRPAGPSDTYDVTLFGKGDGDLFVTFRWTTPVDGPLPKPKARLAVLAGHDGAIDSYGVELAVSNLARTPRRAAATVTVIAEDGDRLEFKAHRARGRCFPDGTIYWDGPDHQGHAAARLGEGPFTYRVELRLDGVSYFARARWPGGEIRGNEPSVRLDFRPALPALSY